MELVFAPEERDVYSLPMKNAERPAWIRSPVNAELPRVQSSPRSVGLSVERPILGLT